MKILFTLVLALALGSAQAQAQSNRGGGNQGGGFGNNCTGNQGNSLPTGCAAGGGNGQYGSNGDRGNNGHNGQYGNNGDRGNNGHNGQYGNNGDRGNNGHNGQYGNNGDRGNNGHNGQYGNNGDRGNNGHNGQYGNNGDRGNNGHNGHHGNNGDRGDNGHNGHHGNNGDRGDNGHNGHHGNNGHHGDNGDNGHYGDNGDDGDNGDYGDNGDNGDDGDNGDYGDYGDNGDNGDNGDPDRKLKFKVRPLVIFDTDAITRVFNLSGDDCPSKGDCKLFGRDSILDRASPLDLDDNRNGFLVERWSGWLFGLGLSGVWSYDNATGLRDLLTWQVGLAPIKGKKSLVRMYVPTRAAVENLPERGVPTTPGQVAKWADGDSILYESTGGAVFFASGGIPWLQAGGTVITKSDWSTYVEKVDKNTIYVTMQTAKTHSAIAFAGTVAASISAGTVEKIGSGYSYAFDISDPMAFQAYLKMINGNLTEAQTMAQNNSGTVWHADDLSFMMSGKMSRVTLGIPFMYTSSSKGTFYNITDVKNHLDGFRSTTEYGIFAKEINNRLFKRHKNLIRSFTGGTLTTRDMETGNIFTRDFLGTYLWQYEKDHAKTKNVNKAIELLIEDTGLEKELAVRVPGKRRDKLGYTRVKFEFKMSAQYVQSMLSGSGANLKLAMKKSLAKVLPYFNRGDRYNICNQGDAAARSSCHSDVYSDTMSAFNQMGRELQAMKASAGSNSKEFAKAFARFGKLMMTNQFTMAPILDYAKVCGGSIGYEINGLRVSRHIVQKAWIHNSRDCAL